MTHKPWALRVTWNQSSMFSPMELPVMTIEELRERYVFEWDEKPVPQADGFPQFTELPPGSAEREDER